MNGVKWLLCASLALAAATAGAADDAARWDRSSALAAARAVDAQPLVEELQRLTIAGDGPATLALLERTRTREDWPAPARDAALHEYLAGLRGLPAQTVPPSVLRYLRDLHPLTLVPHEDHAGGAVPLFNLRAAVAGLEHGWLRDEARLEGEALLRLEPRALADLFLLERHPAARAGYLDALLRADPSALQELASLTARRLDGSPELTPLAGHAALLAGDGATLVAVLKAGEGSAIAGLLRAAALQAPEASAALMIDLVDGTGDHTAATAMAVLYPAARSEPRARELLLRKLSDPELGAAAAVALARDDTPATRAALRELAAGDSQAAARARLALSLVAEELLP